MNRRHFVTAVTGVGVSTTAGCVGGLLSGDEELPEEAPDEAWDSYDGSGGVGGLSVDGVVELEKRQYVHEEVRPNDDADLTATIQVEGGAVDFNILRSEDFETWLEQDFAEGVSMHPSSEVTLQDKTVEAHLWPPTWHLVVYNGPNGPEQPDWGSVRVELSLQVDPRE